MIKINPAFIYIILAFLLLQACDNSSSKGPSVDSSSLEEVDVKIHRYGKALSETDTANFLNDVSKLQDEFVLFIGSDSYTFERLVPLYEYVTDTQIMLLSDRVMELYPNLAQEETELSDAFSRFHYFFPDLKIPVVYSYISNLYHEKPVIVDDSVVIIALDIYLGEDFTGYRSLGLPHYKIRCMTSDNIIIDVMKAMYVSELAPRGSQKTLVDRMVAAGKLLYYLDAVLPRVPDSLKICYNSTQMDWIEKHKTNVWAFLVENKLFYSADYKIQTKLIQDGPFTTGFTNDSPPRLGIWLGWQIVRKYMDEHPDVSIDELIKNTDNQGIFNQSGYKP
ncbi:MAG: hypothetical protein QM503_10095 [Bacteroidota bacterium]